MDISYSIQYAQAVVEKDIPKLSAQEKKVIRSAIEQKLTQHPEVFGKPLRYSLKGARSFRVGDYRVIFCITKKIVTIYAIQHRSVVYKNTKKRL